MSNEFSRIDECRFVELAKAGMTRKQLSIEFCVTHQAISQKVIKLGMVQLFEEMKLQRKRSVKTKTEQKYEMPTEQIARLREAGAISAFRRQRQNARNRGIPWRLSLSEWWQIWQDSGKWELRGRSMGGWVMGRYGDVGAYEVGNVYVCNHSENAQVRSSRLASSQLAKCTSD